MKCSIAGTFKNSYLVKKLKIQLRHPPTTSLEISPNLHNSAFINSTSQHQRSLGFPIIPWGTGEIKVNQPLIFTKEDP